MERSGNVFASWTLARHYGFTDLDGSQPHWGEYVTRSIEDILAHGGPADEGERFWIDAWYQQLRDGSH